MTFLISLFVTSKNLLFGVFLPKKISTILRKIAINFRQMSLNGVLLSVSVLECFGKSFKSTSEKVESLKTLYYTWTSSQVIFKVSSRVFFHLFTYPPIYRSLFVSYIAHILCIRIHICKGYYFFLTSTLPEMESER